MSKINLPQSINSAEPVKIDDSTRCVTIIGANGAGKSRFAEATARATGTAAMRLSALKAIYDRDYVDHAERSIDAMFDSAVSELPVLNASVRGGFERLMVVLTAAEMKLMFAEHFGMGHSRRKPSPLEKVASLWQEIFPDARVLIESGALRFRRDDADDDYSDSRLSDGEKAVLFYLAAAVLAPHGSVLVIDTPEQFLNRSMVGKVWDRVESLRPDCKMVYVTHDLDFASSRDTRGHSAVVWVRRYDAAAHAWDYQLMPPHQGITEEVFQAVIGSRKPVLFIEGDGVNSIDARLYPLVFKDYDVKSLGSCNRVIEATRTFNGLTGLHSLDSMGIVDRDRRNEHEVAYLRRRRVMVPEVAEIENILMLEEVIRAVATHHGRDEHRAFAKVKHSLMASFAGELEQQALLHTRHRVKVEAEHTVDRKFADINRLECHLAALVRMIKPREFYNDTCHRFRALLKADDYAGVLKVYNRKSILASTDVARLTGVKSGDRQGYINAVIEILSGHSREAARIARAIKTCFGLEQ